MFGSAGAGWRDAGLAAEGVPACPHHLWPEHRAVLQKCPQSGRRSPVPPTAALGLPLVHPCPVCGTSSATRGTGEGTSPCPSCDKHHHKHNRTETTQTPNGCSHSQGTKWLVLFPAAGEVAGHRLRSLRGGDTAVTGNWGTAWPRTSPTHLILPLGLSRGRTLHWDHPSRALAEAPPQRGAASRTWDGVGDDHEDQQPGSYLGALQRIS